MAASGQAPLKTEGVPRSRSEGNLVDEQNSSTHYDEADCQDNDVLPDWPDVSPQHVSPISKTTNPFWNGLSASNPFLDDIAQLRNTGKKKTTSILKEDPFLFFREVEEDSSSGDELNVHQLLRKSSSRKYGKSKSVSELLDIVDATLSTEISDQILRHDMEWLQHDREAYKMAWLSQRQLARSCLDLNTKSYSPGWAQTQVADTVILCKLDHKGGSVQLPGSHITVYVPQGHVRTGEFQEISLRAFLDPPETLNHDLSCTVSPLLEIRLSNLDTKEAILLEMKISAEVKQDPFSQVMGMLTCLHSSNKGGSFKEFSTCYIYNDTIQVKLLELSHVMYIVVVARAKAIQAPARSVWDYIHKTIYVGIYGPKYIHPSFTAIFTLWGHSYMPSNLTITDINRSGKNVSPVVFQLWGKHSFLLNQPHDLHISVFSHDLDFKVKEDDQRKEIKQEQLKAGEVIHQQFLFSAMDSKTLHTFVFLVQIHMPNKNPVAQFYVRTPDPAPNFSRIPSQSNSLKMEGIKSYPLFPALAAKYPKFQDKTLHFIHYGVTLKTVLRQHKIDYLLEYFKGDNIALLGGGKVKAIGQTKVKEWYVGVLQGKLGLVRCKNVKVISREQVIDMSESVFTTQKLLEQAALPFKKMTYIYSTVLTLVSEKILDWKALADALGYSQLTTEDFDQMQVDKETERVSYIVKKLKEDCHTDRNRRSFLYELVVALLKIDCQGLVAHLIRETVILTSAVKLGKGWRELAEKLVRLTKQQIEAYEIPHRGKAGEVVTEMMWKPAYDFLYTWGAHYGESYRDVLQDLQLALDRMKNPVTKHWRELTGALILVNCLEVLRATSFHVSEE
ncbi:metastasis-associated in colon cancer protein 1 [Dromiciops gliroides]|uniref:metastasis-associated in colon cancer protein 1 n=1 Tax=Dromiciops gliroides TaxID=33562 RepID=UPI001CC71A9E|nr:metastasis-associated in colon cancer protein 1 [Dromiciops gliroides]